jgi:predicted phosphodiesterase
VRRIAVFSDIHGNIRALEAVLADIDARGVAECYCLGDLVGYGAEPGAVIERIRALGTPTVRGNYDDGVGNRRGECGCYYATPEARADGEASYAWTDATLDDADHAWLAALPDELRLEVDGVRVLLAHGSPRKINEYLLPDRTDAQLARLAVEADADVVCVGHIHIPYHRALLAENGAHIHYVSSGSVGKPKDGDPRACWVEVVIGTPDEVDAAAPNDLAAECAAGGLWAGAIAHRVAYDVGAAAAAVIAAGLPARLAEALRRA